MYRVAHVQITDGPILRCYCQPDLGIHEGDECIVEAKKVLEIGCVKDLETNDLSISDLLNRSLRWAFRQEGSGTQRFFLETLANQNRSISQLNKITITQTESEAAALLNLKQVDIAPGSRSTAQQYGLNFVASGWEAIDIVLGQKVYFRQLFQNLIEQLRDNDTQELAQNLGGYNFDDLGSIVWSND